MHYLIQMNNIKVDFLPQTFRLSHLHRREALRHNWQMDNTEYEDKTPFFIKYGYIWVFSGFGKEHRNDLMKQEELLKKILDLEKKIEEKGKATSAQQNQLNKAYQESFKAKSASYDLEKKINDFNKSALGRAGKKLGIDKQMNNLAALRENGSKKDIKNADKIKNLNLVKEAYIILDDKRIAFNLNTKKDYELLSSS